MSYDIPTIMKRLTNLGENPANYFCDPDVQNSYCKYNYDNFYRNDFKNKSESFDCISKSMWIDQMLNYAGVRKSKSDYGGNNLDNIANIELGAEKRRYSKSTVTVINGAIEEYWNFVKYSINDVLLQYGIDKNTNDTIALFEQALYGGTRFSKVLKQSVYLKNVFAIDYIKKYNLIPGNNINTTYVGRTEVDNIKGEDFDDIVLRGALVGNPLLNGHNGILFLHQRSNSIFTFVIDMDYNSLYPNIKITSNIAPYTQYGRIIVPEQCIDDENPDDDPKFMRGGRLIEDYETDDTSMTAKWIGINDVMHYINKYSTWRLK